MQTSSETSRSRDALGLLYHVYQKGFQTGGLLGLGVTVPLVAYRVLQPIVAGTAGTFEQRDAIAHARTCLRGAAYGAAAGGSAVGEAERPLQAAEFASLSNCQTMHCAHACGLRPSMTAVYPHRAPLGNASVSVSGAPDGRRTPTSPRCCPRGCCGGKVHAHQPRRAEDKGAQACRQLQRAARREVWPGGDGAGRRGHGCAAHPPGQRHVPRRHRRLRDRLAAWSHGPQGDAAGGAGPTACRLKPAVELSRRR